MAAGLQPPYMKTLEQFSRLIRVNPKVADDPEDDHRVLTLFRNRAELKKAYGEPAGGGLSPAGPHQAAGGRDGARPGNARLTGVATGAHGDRLPRVGVLSAAGHVAAGPGKSSSSSPRNWAPSRRSANGAPCSLNSIARSSRGVRPPRAHCVPHRLSSTMHSSSWLSLRRGAGSSRASGITSNAATWIIA